MKQIGLLLFTSLWACAALAQEIQFPHFGHSLGQIPLGTYQISAFRKVSSRFPGVELHARFKVPGDPKVTDDLEIVAEGNVVTPSGEETINVSPTQIVTDSQISDPKLARLELSLGEGKIKNVGTSDLVRRTERHVEGRKGRGTPDQDGIFRYVMTDDHSRPLIKKSDAYRVSGETLSIFMRIEHFDKNENRTGMTTLQIDYRKVK